MKEKGVITMALVAALLMIAGAVMITMGCRIPFVQDEEPVTVAEEIPEPEPEPLVLLHHCHLCYADKPETHSVYVDGKHFTDICDDCLNKFRMVLDEDDPF